MSFERLFSPLKVGSLTLRNRIIVPPHGVSFLPGYGNGLDRVGDYHVERAKGGAAMLVMSNFIIPASWRTLGSWGGNVDISGLGGLDLANDDDLKPAYERLIRGVHQHGAHFLSQLNASGRQHYGPAMTNFGIPLWAPSPLPCPKTRQIPKEMTVDDIAEYVETYVHAARNMRDVGADGVEVFAAQGYLIHEFLSPASNWRSDAYGGGIENRMRFLMEVIAAIRAMAGRDFVVGVRMNADDFSAGGIDLDMARDIARRLAASGQVDYLNVSGMTYLQFPGWIADMTKPEAMFSDLSKEIKAAVPDTPVCVVSRIGSPELAEKLLAEGKADMVGMVRALIADPELPNKAMAGDLDDIRQCTYSNQSCLMGLQSGRGVSCLHNVAVGKEAQLGIGKMRAAVRSKRVVVVGGGPAGMAAARIAIERGHKVTLFEKADRLGGQNLMTAAIATRKNFGEVTRWQEHRLRRMQADIRLGHAAQVDDVLALSPDAVIVATGSRPRTSGYSSIRPEIAELPGARLPHVKSIWDVFSDVAGIGKLVLVVDEDPHLSAAYTAEHLADHGRTVTIVTSQLHMARDLAINHVPELYERLRPKGIEVVTSTLVTAIGPSDVHCVDRYNHEQRTLRAVDTVVLATGNVAEDSLVRELRGKVADLHAIGDCLAPRRIDDAVLDGERAGWMV